MGAALKAETSRETAGGVAASPVAELGRSLADQAFHKLKTSILQNEYPPGFQATEPEIASRLNMSRTPMREAMMRLQSEGLIEVTPRRGFRVLPLFADDLREIYEVLISLEPTAAELFARRKLPPDAEVFVELEKTNERMAEALERDDLDTWAAMDGRFHSLIIENCGNSRIARVTWNVWDQSHRARLVTAKLRPRPTHSFKEHRAVLEAIQRGDERAAHEVHRAHRHRGMTVILETIEKHGLGHL